METNVSCSAYPMYGPRTTASEFHRRTGPAARPPSLRRKRMILPMGTRPTAAWRSSRSNVEPSCADNMAGRTMLSVTTTKRASAIRDRVRPSAISCLHVVGEDLEEVGNNRIAFERDLQRPVHVHGRSGLLGRAGERDADVGVLRLP